MFLWAVLEPCLVVLSVVFIVSQIIIPAFLDRPCFPLFRRRGRELSAVSGELEEIAVEKDIQSMQAILEQEKKTLKKARGKKGE